MRNLFDAVIAVFRDRTADVLCALASHLPAWAGLALAWVAAWVAAQMLVRLAPLAGLYVVAHQHTAAWCRALAARWAAWLDAHDMSSTAMRVRVVNNLA